MCHVTQAQGSSDARSDQSLARCSRTSDIDTTFIRNPLRYCIPLCFLTHALPPHACTQCYNQVTFECITLGTLSLTLPLSPSVALSLILFSLSPSYTHTLSACAAWHRVHPWPYPSSRSPPLPLSLLCITLSLLVPVLKSWLFFWLLSLSVPLCPSLSSPVCLLHVSLSPAQTVKMGQATSSGQASKLNLMGKSTGGLLDVSDSAYKHVAEAYNLTSGFIYIHGRGLQADFRVYILVSLNPEPWCP